MADSEKPDDMPEEEPERQSPAPAASAQTTGSGGGFFSIYKSGQGYWTRMVTAGVLLLLMALVTQWFYQQALAQPVFDKLTSAWKVGVAAALILLAAFFIWRYLNKPHTVDFLIETEKEMAKVNWTNRRELIGSTKVVIIFMFLISAILFVYDLLFGYLFKLIGILKVGPLG
ncbi:MAG: preprotein translocase subunit SecE [Tepidisphaeraceae bacterium]|jgi:preprotein translocase SecE subunit